MSSASNSSKASSISIADADPITRNALRYTISAREYELLHQYLISRAPALDKRSPKPQRREPGGVLPDSHDYNAATIRLTLRLFLTSYTGLKLWDFVLERVLKRTPET